MTHEYTITRKDAESDLNALRSVLHGFPSGISSSSRPALQELVAAIEEQLKPDEPTEFGSIVRAGYPSQPPHTAYPLWHPSPMHGKHYWESETGAVEVWPELTDVEVLRVGLGETNADECHLEEAAYSHGYKVGSETMNASVHHRLKRLLDEAITSERKNAYEKAIQAVEELAP